MHKGTVRMRVNLAVYTPQCMNEKNGHFLRDAVVCMPCYRV